MNTNIDRGQEMREVWQSALAILEEQVPEPGFRTWLEGTRLKEIEGSNARPATAVVAVPSAFAAEWLQRRYGRPIAEALKTCLGHSVGVSFTVETPTSHRAIRALDGIPRYAQGNEVEKHQMPLAVGQSGPVSLIATPTQVEDSNTYSDRVPSAPARADPLADRAPSPALNPRYTFERFLVSRSNQLAASVARRVSEEPGAAYNPLFIYGFRGIGKTHLLQAIGNDAYSHRRSRVLCVSATLFDNQAGDSRLTSPDALSDIDLLLVDDLHHIAGVSGRAAQRSLLVLVEGLLAAGKGIVMTATQPPDSMLALQDNLRSRLREGMVVALELPDAEMRLRLVTQLAQRAGKLVAQDALELLASSGRSMADLVSLWEQVVARCGQGAVQEESSEHGRVLTMQDVESVLAQISSKTILTPYIGPERIINQVESYFNLETNEMCSSSREQRVMLPRQIAMYLIREQTDCSYKWIAHRFARQDHTTAMNSCARMEELSETSLEIRQTMLELRQMIYGEHERVSPPELAS